MEHFLTESAAGAGRAVRTNDTAVLPPLLHSPERAAERLEISRSRVYELLSTGDLESVKIGRVRRIPEAALVEFVARLRGQSKAVA